eukprot:6105489-Amphidinium_carterae.1
MCTKELAIDSWGSSKSDCPATCDTFPWPCMNQNERLFKATISGCGRACYPCLSLQLENARGVSRWNYMDP